MTTAIDNFRRTLEDSVEGEVSANADELARSIVTALWNSVDDEIGRYRQQAIDAERMRDFHQRSAEHIAAKRSLAESVLVTWERGRLDPEKALRMIRAALAVGDVKTWGQLLEAAS